MGKEITLFKSEEKKDLQDVCTFLRQLADRLEQNRVVLRRGEDEVTLDIPSVVILELKLEEETQKGQPKRSLEIELEWVEGEDQGGAVVLG